MRENVKYIVLSLLIPCLNKMIEVSFFIYKIIRHPIKNISIWMVGITSFVMYENIEIKFIGKNMFIMSIGLVSILTFISNFLEKQTIDIDNKENFYLGYNIKKLKFHDNFWLKRFNELSVRFLLWVVAIFPIMHIFSEQKYSYEILSEIFEKVAKGMKYIDSIWLAVFVIISLYCTGLLIESVALSSKSFMQSNLYKTTNISEKYMIETKIEHKFRNLFKDIFNFKNIIGQNTNFLNKTEKAITYIVNRGNDVSSSNDEKIKYYSLAFHCEIKEINKFLNKAYKYEKYDKKIRYSVYTFLFSKIMESFRFYYSRKWHTLNELEVLPLTIIDIAIQDLRRLLEIETKLHRNEEYKNIFWGIYTDNKYYLFSKDKKKSNLCISKICAILEKKFRDINFLNQCNNIDSMIELFDVLNGIDNQVKNNRYLSSIFEILFEHIVDNENKDNEFVKLFYDKMKKQGLPEYLISKRNEASKNILLRGKLMSNNIIEYLLGFMQLEDVIVILIFRLAYSDCSGRAIMKIDEFKVWERVINKSIIRKDIDDLKKSKFIDELCSEISNSNVSHFIFEQFIKWMWDSLFENFDEKKYEEFIKLGEEGIRRDFSLDRYIIVRLLLCNYPYRSLWTYEFTVQNKKQIENKLCSIKDILYMEGIYI